MVSAVVQQFRDGLRQIFSKAQETITYHSITRGRDADDNPIEYITPSSVQAVVQILRLDDITEYAGTLEVGDAMVFFKHDASVSTEDRIIHNGVTYRIIDVFPEMVNGETIFFQALCKREKYKPSGEAHYLKTLSESMEMADSVSGTIL